jgi:putative Holliday junction resolvase
MRIISLDLGSKSLGIAVTDSLQMIVNPLENFFFKENNFNIALAKIMSLLDYYKNDVEAIVLGYPINMDGSKSSTTKMILEFKKSLKKVLPKEIKLVLQDERLTTKKSISDLKEYGFKMSKIKKVKDKMSAVYILQDFLHAKK